MKTLDWQELREELGSGTHTLARIVEVVQRCNDLCLPSGWASEVPRELGELGESVLVLASLRVPYRNEEEYEAVQMRIEMVDVDDYRWDGTWR